MASVLHPGTVDLGWPQGLTFTTFAFQDRTVGCCSVYSLYRTATVACCQVKARGDGCASKSELACSRSKLTTTAWCTCSSAKRTLLRFGCYDCACCLALPAHVRKQSERSGAAVSSRPGTFQIARLWIEVPAAAKVSHQAKLSRLAFDLTCG